jgi:hypothetical protein
VAFLLWACHALGRWAFIGPTLVGGLGRVASKYNTSEFKEKKSKKNKTSKHEGGKSLPSYSLGGGVWPLLKTFLGVARAAP